MPTRSPALIFCPPISVSSLAVRWNRHDRRRPPDDLIGCGLGTLGLVDLPLIGVLHERDHPWLMAFRVVSLPATDSRIVKKPNSVRRPVPDRRCPR